jgi:drug/metabolite transporter (DMT)-like permease
MLFALFQLIAKSFIDKIGPPLFTCLAMLGAAAAIFSHFLIMALTTKGVAEALDIPSRIYWLGLIIAVFSTLLPSFFMNIAIGRIGAQRVAMLGMFGPLATIGAAIWVLDEPFGIWDAVGTAITLAGIALYMKSSKAKPRKT